MSVIQFACYIRELLSEVVLTKVGCNMGGTFVNILAYADNIILMAPSWRGLQHLLDVAVLHSKAIHVP